MYSSQYIVPYGTSLPQPGCLHGVFDLRGMVPTSSPVPLHYPVNATNRTVLVTGKNLPLDCAVLLQSGIFLQTYFKYFLTIENHERALIIFASLYPNCKFAFDLLRIKGP